MRAMLSGFKTIIGALIAAMPALAGLFGYDVAPRFGEEATELIEDSIVLAGTIIAIYGRLVAQAPGWFAKHSATE
jgi:hypothetical protein